jgi:hypothetical protein
MVVTICAASAKHGFPARESQCAGRLVSAGAARGELVSVLKDEVPDGIIAR